MEARAPRVRRPASLSHNVLAVRRAACMGPRATPAPPSPAPQPPTDDRRPVLCIVKIDDRLLALLIARNYPSIAKFQSHQRLHNSCYGACEWDVCRWRQKLFALEHMSTIRLH
ncbi:hypothetical protein KGM_205810 [Danaus plexippus plexippus]|uniref:Uncharacterized protein n=1 Tax=Danaus plexippus plexippus TaxID=278856 RepID=A0A212FAA1_DANPL|nr:hypothetical protein KGM_205810 [Danaus plexippus plexippus]